MSAQNSGKLNSLLIDLDDTSLVSSRWLRAHDYSNSLVARYVRSGWLVSPARGIYMRKGGRLQWDGVVRSLQVRISDMTRRAGHASRAPECPPAACAGSKRRARLSAERSRVVAELAPARAVERASPESLHETRCHCRCTDPACRRHLAGSRRRNIRRRRAGSGSSAREKLRPVPGRHA
ncbi:AbiEi antitoxin N-terminal domain-containing protein [Burkholderia catarinensis]|uniref:AbiEi antitoxin N-terminal domain-containing protein n=1 Tax=Burkholderia catarinensis TaxID=1108140 RepID=UPI0024849DAA|nr:AbiEi antitoxin N-terminal domain-containing protein [Burkholderia catarinensis]